MPKDELKFYATTALGMEELLTQELKALGIDVLKTSRAGVQFQGTLEAGYRACLWSRIANRILLPLKTFTAADADQLYQGVRSIHWTDHLTSSQTLAVDFSSLKSQITHTHYGALKVKDAIVDQFRSVQGIRPSVDPIHPDLRINVYVNQDEATLSLDLSGESLHKRGYRQEGGSAPLKENLAAALLMQAGWPKAQDVSFLDPMCGSGTLPIEAGLMAARIAPGFLRERFGFSGWLGHIPNLWKRLQEEAKELEIRDPRQLPKIVGYDQDSGAIRIALSNLERAQLSKRVHLEKRELSESNAISPQGVLVVNPPFGERLGEEESLKSLYKQLGDTFKNRFKGWEAYVFTSNPELAKSVGLKAARRTVFYHGPIECRLLKYDLY